MTQRIIPSKTTPETIRFVSFNVCGLRNLFNFDPWSETKTLQGMFDKLDADVICFQEVRIQKKDLPYNLAVVPGFRGFHSFPHFKKGYSGVAVYVRDGINVLHAEDGLSGWLKSKDQPDSNYRQLEQQDMAMSQVPDKFPYRCIGGYPRTVRYVLGEEIDSEGRSVIVDLGFCIVLGLYCPANSLGNKEEFRNNYFKLLDERIRRLTEMGRQVVVMGDLNIAREVYDSCDGIEQALGRGYQRQLREAQNIQNFENKHTKAVTSWWQSTEQRNLMHKWLSPNVKKFMNDETSSALLHDVCREKHPQRLEMYTCWDLRSKAREKNQGQRIDYILASSGLSKFCCKADILPNLQGSDHCPIFADFTIPAEILTNNEKIQQILRMEPVKNLDDQKKHLKKRKLKMNSAYLSDFSTRRSIKTMFSVLNAPGSTATTTTATTIERPSEPTSVSESNIPCSVTSTRSSLKTKEIKPKLNPTSKIAKKPLSSLKDKSQKSILSFFNKNQ